MPWPLISYCECLIHLPSCTGRMARLIVTTMLRKRYAKESRGIKVVAFYEPLKVGDKYGFQSAASTCRPRSVLTCM
jgi:hypothetical protein